MGDRCVPKGPFRSPVTRSAVTVLITLGVIALVLTPGAGAKTAKAPDTDGWSDLEAPVPNNAEASTATSLGSVACGSASFCVASGLYTTSNNGQQGLIDTLSGATWTATEAPVPADGSGVELGNVACGSASFCVIAGSFLDSTGNRQPLIESLSDGTWTAQEVPVPANAESDPYGSLYAASCISAQDCVSVGTYVASNFQQGLIETLSDGTWTASEAPVPSSPILVNLTTVSCTSQGTCVTVGYAILDTLSGGSWSAAPIPVPANAKSPSNAELTDVGCSTDGICAAIGLYDDSSGVRRGFVDLLAAGTWSSSEAPLPSNADSTPYPSLDTVSCASLGACTLVGIYATSDGGVRPFMDTLSGGTWSTTEGPLPSNASNFSNYPFYQDSLACPSPDECTAAGVYAATSGPTGGPPLIESFSGNTWQATQASLPSNATEGTDQLEAVACASTDACVAVGSYQTPYFSLGFIETRFHIYTTDLPDAETGSHYGFQLDAMGEAPPFKWKIVDGRLPRGLALHRDGLLSGKPSRSGASPGVYSFTVQVTTTRSKADPVQSATQALTLTLGYTASVRRITTDGSGRAPAKRRR